MKLKILNSFLIAHTSWPSTVFICNVRNFHRDEQTCGTKCGLRYLKELHREQNYVKSSFLYLSYHCFCTTLHQTSNILHEMAKLNRLKAVLAEKEKTGIWLSQQLGKSNCTVSKWCSNTIQPDLVTLDKIAKLLNMDVKGLLNNTEI